jgi:hypothetical protein
MASRASRGLVGAGPTELRHDLVVEFRRALDGSVALAAILPEPSAMAIVLLMAVVAGLLAELVLTVQVTGHTRNGLVFAFERELLVRDLLAARRIEVQRR